VSPALTRQLGKRLGSLDQSDSGLVIVPDSRGILDKTTDFDPAKHVFLGHDVYERVPEAEESPPERFARWFSTALVTGPLSASKGPGGIKAGQAAGSGTRAAEDAATEGRVAGAGEAKASTAGEQAVRDATAKREVPGATGGSSAAPASVPGVPIGEGEARYVTVGNKQYVALANGNPDLGMIDSPVANAIGREAAPIRLPRATAEGVGEVHIAIGARAEQISAAGYKDPAEFVREVAQNYTQIWKAGGGALLLVKRVPEGDAAGRAHSLIVQLEPAADGSAYEVRTAGVFRGSFPAGATESCSGRGSAPTSLPMTPAARAPFDSVSGSKAGTGSACVGGQSE
jgi:hypothetical protein